MSHRTDTVFDLDVSPDVWERLVHGCRARNADCFTRLVGLTEHRLRRLLQRVVGGRFFRDTAAVDDLLQECYLRAWRTIDRFRGESSLMTWLTRIAINVGLNHRRRERRVSDLPEPDSITDRRGGSLSEAALTAGFAAAVEQLPDDLRTVFVLQQCEDLSYQQIADVIHCPIGTVMSRLHRARSIVLPLLQERLEELVP
jgi:RNA polymerase sigma-70 factor (ECF subfamily)